MQLSAKGAQFITSFEGLSLHAYRDSANIWTIGYGATGPGIHEGVVWTREQAVARFMEDAHSREEQLTELLGKTPTTQNEFDALLSLGYNIGMGALKNSTVLEEHKSGNRKRAAAAFMNWTKSGGKIIGGLIRRRRAETEMYLGDTE